MLYHTKYLIAIILFASISVKSQIYVTNGNVLYTRETNHCPITIVGDTGIYFLDIAITPNGNLYGTNGYQLFYINTQNGSSTLIGNMTEIYDANSLEAIDDNTLVLEEAKYLYAINTSNAAVTELGYIGYEAHGDLAWYDNNLYMAAKLNKLVRLTLNDTNTVLTNVTVVNPTTYCPNCQGLVTVSHEDFEENILLAFCSNSTYEICPIDASYTLRCNEEQYGGAAAPRMPIQNPLLTTCPTELNIEQFEMIANNIKIFPNPAHSQSIIEIRTQQKLYGGVNVRILNVQGQLLIEKKITLSNESSILLDLSSIKLKSSIYIVEVISADFISKSKLLVQK